MRVRVKEDVDDRARTHAEVQAAFINMALDGSPELGVSIRDVIDRQQAIDWNQLEIDPERNK